MDEFDGMIRQAKKTYNPSSNFVEGTMQRLPTKRQPIRHRFRLWLFAASASLAALLLIFIVLPIMKHPTMQGTNQVGPVASTESSAGNSATLPAGTDNSNLANDLNSIEASEAQENTDQSSANTTLNDSSQQITIPTN